MGSFGGFAAWYCAVSTALSAGCPSAWDASFTLGMGPAVALVEAFLVAHVFTIQWPFGFCL